MYNNKITNLTKTLLYLLYDVPGHKISSVQVAWQLLYTRVWYLILNSHQFSENIHVCYNNFIYIQHALKWQYKLKLAAYPLQHVGINPSFSWPFVTFLIDTFSRLLFVWVNDSYHCNSVTNTLQKEICFANGLPIAWTCYYGIQILWKPI